MKDHKLRDKVFNLEDRLCELVRNVDKVTDVCTYCKAVVLKGTLVATGEKYWVKMNWNPGYEREHRGCPSCLADLHKKCQAYKTAMKNKKENK